MLTSAAGAALLVCGLPAALQQHAYSPIIKDVSAQAANRLGSRRHRGDDARRGDRRERHRQPAVSGSRRRFPFIGVAVWTVILLSAPIRRPDWELLGEASRGAAFLLALVLAASMMPVEQLPAAVLADGAGPGLRVCGLRQHPAHEAGARARRLRLGYVGLLCRVRRLDDLVRIVRRCCDLESLPASPFGRRVAAIRLACAGRVCHWVLRDVVAPRLGIRPRSGHAQSSGRIPAVRADPARRRVLPSPHAADRVCRPGGNHHLQARVRLVSAAPRASMDWRSTWRTSG